jgi:hypothetical protein
MDDADTLVRTAESDGDPLGGQGLGGTAELLREGSRRGDAEWLKLFEELGGGTGPLRLTLEEGADSSLDGGQGRRSEGLTDFIFGEAGLAGDVEGGAGGEDPGEGIGEAAGSLGQTGQAPKGGTDGRAERSEDGGEALIQGGEECRFGPAVFGRKVRQADGEGSFGKFGRREPARGGGEEHGAPVVLEQRFRFEARRFAEGRAETGGETAEGIRETGWEGGNMVEGEDPVLA